MNRTAVGIPTGVQAFLRKSGHVIVATKYNLEHIVSKTMNNWPRMIAVPQENKGQYFALLGKDLQEIQKIFYLV